MDGGKGRKAAGFGGVSDSQAMWWRGDHAARIIFPGMTEPILLTVVLLQLLGHGDNVARTGRLVAHIAAQPTSTGDRCTALPMVHHRKLARRQAARDIHVVVEFHPLQGCHGFGAQ